MEDQDQSPRQIALCCLGEAYLSSIMKIGPYTLSEDLLFDDLHTLYTNAKNAGAEGAADVIQKAIERKLPWWKPEVAK